VKLGLYGTRLSRDGAAMLMQDIGKLRNLSILSLAIEELHFKSGIFMSLKVLDLCYAPSTEFKSVKFDDKAMPKLEELHLHIGRTVSFSGVQYLQSIKEIRLRFWYEVPDEFKEPFSRELRGQLDKEKMGHLLKVK
jgi:hypothetical protein